MKLAAFRCTACTTVYDAEVSEPSLVTVPCPICGQQNLVSRASIFGPLTGLCWCERPIDDHPLSATGWILRCEGVKK